MISLITIVRFVKLYFHLFSFFFFAAFTLRKFKAQDQVPGCIRPLFFPFIAIKASRFLGWWALYLLPSSLREKSVPKHTNLKINENKFFIFAKR